MLRIFRPIFCNKSIVHRERSTRYFHPWIGAASRNLSTIHSKFSINININPNISTIFYHRIFFHNQLTIFRYINHK